MKHKLIVLLIFLAGWANAQIGIDLTEMIPAPDSGYMIITTGDEYPDRGLQKYVRASDILGIDTLFQNGDSLCVLMRSEEAYRCFPVHQEVRLEKVDGGLRVCWESRDTIWETRNYLHFPGTSGSYVEARDIHDFEIGDEDVEIEAQWRKYNTAHEYIYATNFYSVHNGYAMRPFTSVQHSVRHSTSASTASVGNPEYNDNEWHTTTMLYEQDDGRLNSTYDSRSATSVNLDIGGEYISNHVPLTLGDLGNKSYPLHGDIRYFRFNDEYFDFSEGSGDTIVSNFGTVMDIKGDVSWAVDTLGFTGIDTSHHCEIIPLTDTHLTNVEHLGDSIRFTLSDSVIFTVRDSFIPQENIIGWIDERIPDTVFFAKTSTATKAIEFGDTLELKGGAININIPVEVDYFPNTNQLEICWTEIELPDQGLQDEGMGSEFNQGGNQTQQLPADTIRLCDTIQLNDVFIDTVFHDGDSMRFVRNDGKSWAVRDSFRTDDDIIDLIDMMYDPQWLDIDRDGNEVTISISDGNSISFIDSVRSPGYIAQVARDSIEFSPDTFLISVSHLGDSIEFIRNDGQRWVVRDSTLSKSDVIEIMRDSIVFPVDTFVTDFFRDGDSLFLERNDGEEWKANIRPTIDQIFDPCGINLIENSHFFLGPYKAINSVKNNFVYGTIYTNFLGIENGVASFEVASNSNAARFEYDFLDLDTNKIYTASLLTSIPSMSATNSWRAFVNATKIEEGKIQVSDSLFLHWASFQPTAESGILRAYYGSIGEGVIFDLHYFMLQECDQPSPWVPNPNDAIQDLSGIRDTLDIHDAQITDLEYFRDTLNPVRVVDFTRSGDSIYLDLSNGQTFAVRDSFLTEAEIQDMVDVNRSWLLKDGGVPDNASDTVYRDGVAVIEAGGNVNRGFEINSNSVKKSIGAITNEVRIKSSSSTSGSFLLVFDSDNDDRVVDNFTIGNTAFTPNAERTIRVYNADKSSRAGIDFHSTNGIRAVPYGTGQFEATPTYLLGVDASGYIKEVRPTSGIDTIIHLGDSIYFDFDDKTFTIRDSVRSDAEIITLIETNRILQELGRSGDFITLSEGGGQVLDLHLKDAIHTGDSVKLVLSDGRNITFRDSSLSVETVRDMIIEEIPETVFYVKQGSVTAPVNWGDVVELENGEVNVNMPTKVKMIDSLNALEVCIWQVLEKGDDTVTQHYIEFNGAGDLRVDDPSMLDVIAFPLEMDVLPFRAGATGGEYLIGNLNTTGESGGMDQFVLQASSSRKFSFFFRYGSGTSQSYSMDAPLISANERYNFRADLESGDLVMYLDGIEQERFPSPSIPTNPTSAYSTRIANSAGGQGRNFRGRIYGLRVGDEVFDFNGSGTTLTGNKGTVFNFTGDAAWGSEEVIVPIPNDTLFQCDTIYLSDIYLDTAYFEDNILTLSRTDGQLFNIEIQASGGDGIDTMYSTSDSLYIVTSTGRTLSAGVAKGDKGDGLEYNWDGTRLGVRVENSGDPFVYVDLEGAKGDTGDDGREIELRVDSEMIQWRYVGESWQNLLPLSALKGEKGDQGDGLEYAWDGTKLGVRVEGSGDPFVYVDLKGEKGEPGDVVGDINIYKDDGIILEDRTAIIEGDNTLRFDLKEKAGFEIGHYSQDGNDSKLINHRTSDNSFMLEIQEIEKDTLWNSRILATSKGIGLRNHKSYGSSISYGTMGIDTTGSYILNLVKDNPGVLFAGRRQFLNRVTDDGHALWDTLGIQDIGITPADTARWGAGGSYTLERDNYRMHLRDASGASKGSFQLQGSDGVEIYPQSNNVFRISGQGITVPSYTTQVSGPAFNLRRDNSTVSTVNFFGTGGINIGGTGSTITIDGSGIGGIQSLSFNPSLTQTTLSGGGGSFRIVGGANTNVSLSAGGVYTISATGGGSMPSYSFNSQGAMLQLSEDGIQRGSYEVRAGTGLSLSTSGTALNRVVTINASGGTSPWTVSGSNIYRNSGVTVGGTTVGNQFRSYLRSHFYDAVGIFEGSNQRGEMYGSGGDFIITNPTGQTTRITSGYIELDGHVGHKLARTTIATLTNPVNEIPSDAGSTNFSFSTARAGTIRYVLNEKSSSITVQGVTIPAGEGKAFMRGTSSWYPISP